MKLFPSWLKKRARVLSESEFIQALNGNLNAAKKNVTPDTAMRIATVFRCVSVLAGTLSSLPCILYRKLPEGGKERATDHPLYQILRYRPNSFTPAVNFFESMMISNVLRGNSYANIIRDGGGRVVDLLYLEPDRMSVDLVKQESGRYEKQFTFMATDGKRQPFGQDEILHITALVTRGVLGMSPIDYARETMGYTMVAEEHGAKSLTNAARPVGILNHPGPGMLSDDAQKNLTKGWFSQAGGDAAYGTPILQGGITYQPIQLTNEQSQFIESRKFQVVEICRWFGVPPHMAMDLERATFSNIEEQFLEFLYTGMLPWFVRFEQSMWFSLLTERERETLFMEFLPDAILRGSTFNRNQSYQIARQGGWMSVDEIRERENMNPLPDGKGKIYLEPLNMKEAGTETPSPSSSASPNPTASPPPSPSQDEAKSPSRHTIDELVERFEPLFEGAMRRAMVKEVKGARDKAQKEKALEIFFDNHEKLLRDVLAPLVQTVAELLGVLEAAEFSQSLAAQFAKSHMGFSRQEMTQIETWESTRLTRDLEIFSNTLRSYLYLEDFEANRPVRNILQLQPIVNVEQKPITTNVTLEQPTEVISEVEAGINAAGNRVYKFKREKVG
jgi:HK97 family phage portal protein